MRDGGTRWHNECADMDVNVILLHGVVGVWDEVICLALPVTVIMAVALAVLREKPQPTGAGDASGGAESSDGDPAEMTARNGMRSDDE